jgi:tRNA threonylcarbamoyladenosine biosynthesis protein TsaB
MNLLGIDTTTGYLGVIAVTGDERALFCGTSGLKHGESLFPVIDRVLEAVALAPSDINLIVCALGPGSFTGLRIGLAAAKGLALSAGCPLAGVSSLDVFGARCAFFQGTVAGVIDARKGRYYAALYRSGVRTSGYLDLPPAELCALLEKEKTVLLTGPDADKLYASAGPAPKPDGVIVHPSYQELDTLLTLGRAAFEAHGPLPDGAGPVYVRSSEAEIVRDRSAGR